MAEERLHRRLAAILSADVVGYSRLISLDEAGTLFRLNAFRRELIEPTITGHSGRIVKLMGDRVLVGFLLLELTRVRDKDNGDGPYAILILSLSGSAKWKIVPEGTLGVVHSLPSCASIMVLQIANPSPIPLIFVVKNGSKILVRLVSSIQTRCRQ
jgi:class 3 adenylate cyclase